MCVMVPIWPHRRLFDLHKYQLWNSRRLDRCRRNWFNIDNSVGCDRSKPDCWVYNQVIAVRHCFPKLAVFPYNKGPSRWLVPRYIRLLWRHPMYVCGLLYAQALTAEVNMQSTQLQEHKSDVLRLRNEITEWKQKYYDCRRKVVAQTQYVRSSLPHFAFVTYAVGD